MEVPLLTFAPCTPLLSDGRVDIEGLERSVSWLRSHGVRSLIAAGTTGEPPLSTRHARTLHCHHSSSFLTTFPSCTLSLCSRFAPHVRLPSFLQLPLSINRPTLPLHSRPSLHTSHDKSNIRSPHSQSASSSSPPPSKKTPHSPPGYVFANVSSCAVEESVELSRLALDSGASPDALLLLPPFYHKPFSVDSGAAGVEAYFTQALSQLANEIEARSSRTVVFLYTFALHTQQPIPPVVYGRLAAAFPSLLKGIKASCVGLDEAQAYADAAPGTVVMVGHGRLQLQLELARNYLLQLISTSSQPVLRAGMHVVSGDCLPVCWALVRLLAYHEEGKPALADEAQRLLIDVWRAEMDLHDEIPINKASFAAIKEVATSPLVRPPLVPVSSEAAAAIVRTMDKLRSEFEALLK